jgi:2-polyprenyl-6-methoxyphenol hydroxylase-like FAD-dependent oxidoreductase
LKSIDLQTSKSEQARIETDVLIVGAGPTGLTLACALARSGINFQIIEVLNGPQPGSRGKGVQPRTLEMFDNLGIVDDVIAMGRLAMPIRKTALDRQVTETGTENLSTRPDVPYPTSLITPEWRVEEALRVCLTELGGAVEFDSALESFVQFQEGISVSIVKGGQAQMITARWLVGCDGGHSHCPQAGWYCF